MNKIRFYVHELEYITQFLYNLKLVDYSSRMRTRFYKILIERIQQYKEEYLELVKEHSNLDDQGQPNIIQEDEKQRYDIKDISLFQQALSPLYNEEFVIEINDNNKNMIKSVKHSILNCGIEFSGEDQFAYDSLCVQFEDLEFEGGA